MKNIALLIVALSFLGVAGAIAQTKEAEPSTKAAVQTDKTEENAKIDKKTTEEVEQETVESPQENAETASEEKKEETKEVFITPEARAKQEIADNNYSLSFFTQRMDLELSQLDQAKKFSEEDKLKRESLLKSIYMLRQQSRELEEQSLERFKGLLNPEQLAVFEELRKEQVNYRDKYDVLAGNVQQQVEKEKQIIAIDTKLMEEEKKKEEEQRKFEEEAERSRAENLKHGRWDLFD